MSTAAQQSSSSSSRSRLAACTTSRVMMIRPVRFAMNSQTKGDNYYQVGDELLTSGMAQARALAQFSALVAQLRASGVDVLGLDDSPEPHKPDSIFPNNWMSTHYNDNTSSSGGSSDLQSERAAESSGAAATAGSTSPSSSPSSTTLVLYPMLWPNRRLERRADLITLLQQRFDISRVLDLTHHETEPPFRFLEGTGSMVLDRAARVCYAALSQRTHASVVDEFCAKMGYTAVKFHANHWVMAEAETSSSDSDNKKDNKEKEKQDVQKKPEEQKVAPTKARKRLPIYHTNVMMCVGHTFAVVCLDSVDDAAEREALCTSLRAAGLKIVDITEQQTECFAGNMLLLQRGGVVPSSSSSSSSSKPILVMSSTAYGSLRADQLAVLSADCDIVHADLSVIERLGGGSARCMIAELFVSPR